MKERGRSEATLKAYNVDLIDLLTSTVAGEQATVGHAYIAGGIDEDNLDQAAAAWLTRGRDTWSPATTKRKMASARSWARWAGVGDILADYRAPQAPAPRPHPLKGGMSDVAKLLDGAEGNIELQAIIALCGYCGLRIGEALAVERDDVDWADEVLLVRGKGAKQREVPIAPKAASYIAAAFVAAHMGERRTLAKYADRRARFLLTEVGQRVGVSVASHDLRATAGTTWHANGATLRTVQELLGHSDSRTTQIYTDATMTEMRKAVAV